MKDNKILVTDINYIRVNPDDKFTYSTHYSFLQYLLNFFDDDLIRSEVPTRIKIYRNGVYDHDIVPTKCTNNTLFIHENGPYAWCQKLNKKAGHPIVIQRYSIDNEGKNYSVRYWPDWGSAYESYHFYDTKVECFKHILNHTTTYDDTEIGFIIEDYDKIFEKFTIKNRKELKQRISEMEG